MSRCRCDPPPPDLTYDANGWRQWCGRCGMPLWDEVDREAPPWWRGFKVAFWLFVWVGLSVGLSMIVAGVFGWAWIEFLFRALTPVILVSATLIGGMIRWPWSDDDADR